ncbi:MAG: hypothetical protein WC943_14405 [Elusimicrobiota bacterium]|jgi:hypothetical protein
MRHTLAVVVLLLACAPAFSEESSSCAVESFAMSLEGWTSAGFAAPKPCEVVAISTQATCPRPPCFNIACRAVIRFKAVVRLPEGVSSFWPACFFKQQRMGLRGHSESGAPFNDEFQPEPAYDFSGDPAAGTGFSLRPVQGRPNTYSVEFYDLPGWVREYFGKIPNATPPCYFPLFWDYMYRAYLGPPVRGIPDDAYRYVRVSMDTGIPPEGAIRLEQSVSGLAAWKAWSERLKGLQARQGMSGQPGKVSALGSGLDGISAGFGPSPAAHASGLRYVPVPVSEKP